MAALLLPGPELLSLIGLVLVGVGCAPIYPSIIHSTPDHFGADKSQAIIGIQMASAYVGNLTMPPLFGLLANNITRTYLSFSLFVYSSTKPPSGVHRAGALCIRFTKCSG